MTLYQILTDPNTGLDLPCVYSHFRDQDVEVSPPYLVYIGDGQDNFEADNSYYWSRNRYQIEYYFTEKDESQEAAIEKVLLDNGYLYTKSEDVYIEEMGVFVIYYNV